MPSVLPSIAVTMRGFDNARSNANLYETHITQATLRKTGVRRQVMVPLTGDARGTEGSTLLAPSMRCPDGLQHDIMIHANMANYVSCHDAIDGTLLWETRIGNPIKGSNRVDAHGINDHWGVLSTGVISFESEAFGCVSWSSPDGRHENARFYFHWLSLFDGTHLANPLDLSSASYEAHSDIPLLLFGAAERKQRCALLIANEVVFIAAGSVLEDRPSNRGWVLAVDVSTVTPILTAAWAATARHTGGGIWMGGQGPAEDNGKLYLITGNGGFQPPYDLGESYVELEYKPGSRLNQGTFFATDWFSRFSDAGRNGEDPTLPEPGEKTASGKPSNMNAYTDMDEGSGGLALIPELGLAIGAGKDGIGCVLRIGKFGKTSNADFTANQTRTNYARPAWIGWFTYFPGWNISPTPETITDLNHLFDGKTHHQHSSPVVYKSSKNGWMVFCWGENAPLRAWSIDKTGHMTFLADSDEIASIDCPPPGGMPGGMMALAANMDVAGSAVLWASIPYGDANTTITQGRLLAYDPENFTQRPDGSMRVVPIWDSERWGLGYVFNKFMPPVPANGRVYLPDYAGNVQIFAP